MAYLRTSSFTYVTTVSLVKLDYIRLHIILAESKNTGIIETR